MTFHQACWLLSNNRDRLIGSSIAGMYIQELVVVPLGKWAAAFDLSPAIIGVSRLALLDSSGPMEIVMLIRDSLEKVYVLPWELADTVIR